MWFLRQLASSRTCFTTISKDKKIFEQLNPTPPVKNGGIKTISRVLAQNYFNSQFQAGKTALKNGVPLIRSVAAFKTSIIEDPVLKMYFRIALDSIPPNGMLAQAHLDEVFSVLSVTATSPPKFQNQQVTGIPFFLLFLDFLDTKPSQIFFANTIVNQHFKEILDDYQAMLCSAVSLEYMNEKQPHGWFSQTVQQFVNYDDYYVDKSKPHWGFQSWNQWFIRKTRPQARPIDQRPNAIVHSSDSYPLYYKQGQLGSNPYYNAKVYDHFWLKDNRYSLYDMLGAEKMGIKALVDKHFEGGTVYQAFLDPFCCHRWHSPVSGTIIKSFKLGGTYFIDSPGYEIAGEAKPSTNFIDSQPMLSAVSVRQVFIIELDDGSGRHIALVEIGMCEISSCQPTVIQGQKVRKGEDLGYFQFGGSSHTIVFDKKFTLQFNPAIKMTNSNGDTLLQKANSWLATFS